jgi:hypoxanthine phosphoribosyltransferase
MSEELITKRDGRLERVTPYLTEDTLRERVRALGKELSRDYEGKDVVAVAVLKGSILFFTDLIREMDVPGLRCDFLGLSSYGSRTESSGVVRLTQDLSMAVEGRHVLVVEDIIDTGLTMQYLLDNLATRKPASVQICTLLHKPSGTKVEVPMKYVGFTIENHFVVGYGLDYDERYRQLPYIGTMSFEQAGD